MIQDYPSLEGAGIDRAPCDPAVTPELEDSSLVVDQSETQGTRDQLHHRTPGSSHIHAPQPRLPQPRR